MSILTKIKKLLQVGADSSAQSPGSKACYAPVRQETGEEWYDRTERQYMPPEIQAAPLLWSERTFYRWGARPFAAKIDQAFRVGGDRFVLVDSKSRHYPRSDDVIQLSCQALAIESHSSGAWKSEPYAYVRLQTGVGAPDYVEVPLLSADDIDVVWDRWRTIKAGEAKEIILRPSQSSCGACANKLYCSSARL